MLIRPTSDNIVLRKPEVETSTTTASGIFIPKSGTEQSLRTDIATVVATGEGRMLNNGTLLPMGVKAGDEVLYNKYAGTEVECNGESFLVIRECDILAIIER